jgi:hypothetical protein
VYSKLYGFIYFSIALMLGFGAASMARTQTPSHAAQAATAAVRGHIADPSGALIPGAKITIATPAGAAVTSTTADTTGAYAINGIKPGSYIVRAFYAGFAPFVSPAIQLAAGQMKQVDISMAIAVAQQSVTVTDESPTVNIEAGGNSNTIVIKGKDLDALSDDPDELSNELTALAGPSAGPNGGQIYIDGFTGGQLPPKSAIREIRINQNPFSAEFDKLGYGRIEILTKPGTDQLHGRFFGMGNDSSFNTGNPFTQTIPPYHSIMMNGTLSGPLSKSASFFFSMEQRNNQDANIYTVQTAAQNAVTGAYYIPMDVNGNVIPVTGGLFTPATLTEITPRIDLQLGQKNTLTLRYQFYRNDISGSIGSTSLPTQSTASDTLEHTLQLDDSQIINDRIVNETRFEYRRGITSSTPVSTAPTVSVPNFFTSGGNVSQNATGHSDHFELQNFTTMTAGAHAIKFGTWLRDNRQATSTDSNYNGNFTFPSLAAYVDTLNGLEQGETVAQIAAACNSPGACTPNKLTYTTGPEAFQGNVFDGALFFQDDWKYSPYLTLSGGLRWETQNHIADHSDWAPRLAFAYALDGHNNHKPTKTVLRGGIGFFYDRFQVANLMNLEQYNGTAKSQTQTVVSNPTCFSATSLSDALSQADSNCSSSGSAVVPQIYKVSPNYHSPYAEQLGASLERQLTKASTLTFTYLHSFGPHQLVVRDSNAYLPGVYNFSDPSASGSRPDPSLGIVDQYYPEAIYKQNQVIVNINARFTHNLGMMGFYNWTSANSDGGGGSNPSNSYDLSQDYGRAPFMRRQMIFLMSNYNGPWGITFNPFLIAQAGKPFNITTTTDLTGDNFFNDRPSYASSAAVPSDVAQTGFGALDTVPQSGENLVPFDLGNSPASVAFNMRVSRAWGLGPKVETPGGPPSGGSHGGRFGGPFGNGGGHGGIFGPASTGHKYTLTFSAQALNMFNDIDYGTPFGTVVPTFNSSTGLYGPGSRFNTSTKLAGGLFSSPTGSAARRIFFQSFFTF